MRILPESTGGSLRDETVGYVSGNGRALESEVRRGYEEQEMQRGDNVEKR